MDLFQAYQKINELYENGDKDDARIELIKTLDVHEKKHIKYNQIINHLIRKIGLYPYIKTDTALWEDSLVYEAFKVNIGKKETVTLHIEQSKILKQLLEGKSLAVSAPTSFGKSFIIDSFIAIKRPNTVVLIVPTIALMDETRRRLQNKFSDKYKIITNSDIKISCKNIFIFPQERAINYADKINSIDLLIIDEFYKADISFDVERAPNLLRAIIKLSKKSKQKYFLAPNITHINHNLFTKDMKYLYSNYNTVFLKILDTYKNITSTNTKEQILLKILHTNYGKTLIYAGTYSAIDEIIEIIKNIQPHTKNNILISFAQWLHKNYTANWDLPLLVKLGFGIHNGKLHRDIAQIQVHLFELENGLQRIISTSSIIEGVNTSAENVIIWKNKNGKQLLNYFTYKNIIGRGGRMFKHFIGKIFLLDQPPVPEATELNLQLPTALMNDIDIVANYEYIDKETILQFNEFEKKIIQLMGEKKYKKLKTEYTLNTTNTDVILKIVTEIHNNPKAWKSLVFLNSNDTSKWDDSLYKILKFHGKWEKKHSQVVKFIKILSDNWHKSIPTLLQEMKMIELNINDFFSLERSVSFKLPALLQDINIIQNLVIDDITIDISPFISKISSAFLPKIVYQLEEYGLPRMISKKIHESQIINLEKDEQEINDIIKIFIKIGESEILSIKTLDEFDKYIIKYFYKGIVINKD